MIVSQFRFLTTKRQRYRLLITNLESVALRFRVDFTAVTPGPPGLPVSAISQLVRDATALNGFDSKVDWQAHADGLCTASGTVEIAPRFTKAVGISGEGANPFGAMVLAGHVELNCPPVMETRTRGRPALGHAVRVLLSAACVKTEKEIESAPGLPGLPLDPEILIGPNLLASGKSEHLIEPESWATSATATAATTARAAPKRRMAKKQGRR